jgi:NADH-quinone oxidoreductase subunit M
MSHFFQNPLIYIVGLLSFGFLFCQILEETKINVVRLFCLNISLAALFLGVLSCLAFNYSAVGFQFLLRLNVLPSDNLSFTLGADGLSMIFLLLTLFVFPVCFASS